MDQQLLRQARHALGMTQSELAAALGIGSWRTVARWEAGDSQVPGPAWVAVSYLLAEIATPERQAARAAIEREILAR